MDCISCWNCGVVLDRDKIYFPEVRDADGDFIPGTGFWDEEKEAHVPMVTCPVCGEKISEEGGPIH